MTPESGPVYEVTFFMDADIAGAFGRWLERWAHDAVRLTGVDDCACYEIPNDANGLARRGCLLMFTGDEALDAFLDSADDDIEASIPPEFAGRVEINARVLREDTRLPDPAIMPDCLNCGARLHGQYCAVCGQRAGNRLISLWELITDAFGDVFELDSRLWKTLGPLLARPGRLTLDYLQGRRARYMPPFRMYLVLSLLFFLIAFFDPHRQLGLFMEPPPETDEAAQPADADQVRQQVAEELAKSGVIVGDELPPEAREKVKGLNIQLDGGNPTAQCDLGDLDTSGLPGPLKYWFSKERLTRVCERTQIDNGRALLDKLLDEVPTALIVLLPLMAFVLKLLYPLARRYYVEHLLFFVHFHSFFFLILTLQILFVRLAILFAVPEPLRVLPIVAVSFYVPVYLFVAMRRVYAQGRIVTFIKYIPLVFSYALGFSATMLGALAVAAFSV